MTYHKSVSDNGGAIGDEIFSGNLGALMPEVLLSEQTSGTTISRKFYIENLSNEDLVISALSMDNDVAFVAILFESSGDTQVVGDLTGSETDESPINVTIGSMKHKSFWLQINVPTGSTITSSYGTADIKQIN